MPDKIGRALTARPTFERDITRTVTPEPVTLPLGAPSIIGNVVDPSAPSGAVSGSPRVGNQIFPPIEQQTETQQVKGAPFSLTLLADFLTSFGGGPQAALQQQAFRRQGINQQFDVAQEQADREATLSQQNFQRTLGLRRLGISERDISLREQRFARPKISTFQSRDGRRLLTINTQTGELINSLNVSEQLSPQVVADFISNFENALGSPLNPNEQATISAAGQSALQNGDLGAVASALDGIAAGREGFRRSKELSREVGKRQLFSDQRRAERE